MAYSLAHLNRYTGHVGVYSVAQHSCLMVSNNNTPCDARVLLLHDAAEAFLSDIAAPVKHEF
jgi:5'-deoxynucleotidase YfbR-like HD superfamily hydrolase